MNVKQQISSTLSPSRPQSSHSVSFISAFEENSYDCSSKRWRFLQHALTHLHTHTRAHTLVLHKPPLPTFYHTQNCRICLPFPRNGFMCLNNNIMILYIFKIGSLSPLHPPPPISLSFSPYSFRNMNVATSDLPLPFVSSNSLCSPPPPPTSGIISD